MNRTHRSLGLVRAACVLAAAASFAAASPARADCAVTYAIASQWNPGFGANVTIKNTGAAPVNGWTLGWTFANGQAVTQLWNGVVTQTGAQVSVRDAGYNATIPANGSVSFGFNGTWSGTNSLPTSFTLNGAVCGGGSTPTSYGLTVGSTGSGSTTPAAGTYSYASGATVTVTAVAAAGATFTGWSGAATGTANPVAIVMNGNKTLTANFTTATTRYALAIATVGNGTTTPAAGTWSYPSGTVVTVTATPAAGATFTGWSDAATGTANPVTVVMSTNKTLTANFSGGGTGGSVRWVGRVIPLSATSAKLGWQGSGVVATVRGTTIAARLRSEGDVTFFQPVIDGTARPRFSVASGAEQVVTLATGLTDAEHKVELYRETEGWATATFLGFTSGTVTGAPAWSGRLIEVVGDSITAGYGDLGSELHPNWVANPACHYTPDNSSWFVTYGAVAGRALGADVSSIAHSGWGLYYDRSGSQTATMPNVWDYALSNGDPTVWTFSPQPQAVVINLGTNDTNAPGGFPSASYTSAGIAFAQRIRAKYPTAWIFFTIGPMLNQGQTDAVNAAQAAIVSARKAAGDTRIASFDFGQQNLGANGEIPSGCDWHPSVAEHQRMAGILQAKLQAALGW